MYVANIVEATYMWKKSTVNIQLTTYLDTFAYMHLSLSTLTFKVDFDSEVKLLPLKRKQKPYSCTLMTSFWPFTGTGLCLI